MSTRLTAPTIGYNKRYTLKHRLGEGGMGSVYLAYDQEREIHIALKRISRGSGADIYRLKNEFRSLADITHPNLVTLYELISEGDDWFITMELIDGFGYYEYVFGKEAMSDPCRITITDTTPMIQSCRANIPRLRSVLAQLSIAIDALHQAGKLHRDIKPSNIMVTREGRVVVLDFGLVRENQILDIDRTLESDLLGTPAYMSPEQAAGHPLTLASDWYSLGVMLYETLTNRLPFEGSVLNIMQEKVLYDPIPPSKFIKNVPSDLDDICIRLLNRIPEDRPSTEEIITTFNGTSYSSLAVRTQSTPPPKTYRKPLIGRKAELQSLYHAFESLQEDNPIIAYVHGSSGIGKTALIQRFLHELMEDKKAIVFKGRCFERESVPYKALDNVVDSLTRYLTHLSPTDVSTILPRDIHSLAVLFPVLQKVSYINESKGRSAQSADPRILRNRAFSAFKEFLQRLSDIQPVVVAIEDLHWGDVDSARLLLEMLGPPDPPPILLICSYRSDEVDKSPFLQEVLNPEAFHTYRSTIRDIGLNKLDMFEAQQMAQHILDEPSLFPSDLAQKIAEEAEQIPIFITELARYTKAHIASDGSIPPTSLEQVIVDRVSTLEDDAKRVLEIFAVAARPTEQAVALYAAGLPPGDRAPLVKLRNARLIRSHGVRRIDTAETYHSRISDAVVRNLIPKRLKECHLSLAQSIVKSGINDPERLVTYYRGADHLSQAGEQAVKAAYQAESKLAFNRAAELYRTAIELLPKEEGQQLYQQLGDALANSGRGAEAADIYLMLRRQTSGQEAREVGRKAARQLLRSGRFEQGIQLSKELLKELGLRYPSGKTSALTTVLLNRMKARLSSEAFRSLDSSRERVESKLYERLETLGFIFMEVTATDALPGAALQTQFLQCAIKAGEPQQLLRGFAWEVATSSLAGGTSNERWAERLLRHMQTLASDLGTSYGYATTRLANATFNLFSGRYSDGVCYAKEAVRQFRDECTGASWEHNYATAILYGLLEFAGGINRIVKEAPQKAREARERDDQFLKGFLALSVPFAHLMCGDVKMAEQVLEEQRQQLKGPFNNYHLWVMMRSIDTYLYRGQGMAALEYLDQVWPAFQQTFMSRTKFFTMTTRFHHARCAITAAQESKDRSFLELAAKDAKVLINLRRKDAESLATMVNAAIAFNTGEVETSISLLQKATRMCREYQMEMLATYCRWNLGHISENSEDRELKNLAGAVLQTEGIKDPDRWTAVRFPGFYY